MTTSPRLVARCATAVASVAVTLLALPAGAAAPATKAYVVQGVPKASVDITVDGTLVRSGTPTRTVLGPLPLSGGSHTVVFRTGSWTVRTSFHAGAPSLDVVLHLPAQPSDRPVVTTFTNKVAPVPSGKGRLTVAHTAVVPPADIRASGKVLFSNIANGEFVTAEVPVGSYSVDVVPTGGTTPLLGPLHVPVKAGTLTNVFAIGSPRNGSMGAVVQVLDVPVRATTPMGSVNAGSAGLAAPATGAATPGTDQAPALLALVIAITGAVLLGWRRHVRG